MEGLFIQLIFGVIALFMLGSALAVVTVRNLVHAALWLIAAFFAAGALYILLEAPFLGVAQILLYVGAIAILILFAIMLTPAVDDDVAERSRRWWAALVGCGLLFALLLAPTLLTYPWNDAARNAAPVEIASVREIGIAFMQEFFLPFQVAAILLLAAMVGAVAVAIEQRSKRRVLTLAEEVALRDGGESNP